MEDLQNLLEELTCGDDHRSEQAARGLASHGEQALVSILPLLRHPEADKRWWGLRALAEVAHPSVAGSLISALDDPDANVRRCAALGLQRHPSREAIPGLIRSLQEGDRLLARLAGNALAAIGKPALPLLQASCRSDDPAVRIEAVRAVAIMDQPEATPLLHSALEDDSSLVQFWAEEGLDRLGHGMVFFKP